MNILVVITVEVLATIYRAKDWWGKTLTMGHAQIECRFHRRNFAMHKVHQGEAEPSNFCTIHSYIYNMFILLHNNNSTVPLTLGGTYWLEINRLLVPHQRKRGTYSYTYNNYFIRHVWILWYTNNNFII